MEIIRRFVADSDGAHNVVEWGPAAPRPRDPARRSNINILLVECVTKTDKGDK